MEEPFLNVENVNFQKESGSKVLPVKTNIDNWKINASPIDWLTIKREGHNINLSVLENKGTTRSFKFLVEGGGLSKEVQVTQIGVAPDITFDNQSFKIEKFSQEIQLTVTANVSYETVLPDWIKEKSKEILSDGVVKYVFSISENNTQSNRNGFITFQSKGINPVISKELQISQKGEYGNDDASSIESDIKLKIHRGTATSHQNGTPIENSFDGDMATIYHSNWSNGEANYFPIIIEYFFETPQDVDYMMYYPRTEGYNGHFKQVEIQVATEANPSYIKLKDFDFKGNGKVTRVEFSPITKAKSFKLIIKSGYGDGQGFAAAAEMEFYKKSTGSFDPTSIFTDITCSELKPNVTDEQIQNISNPFYKNIAQYMKLGQYPSEFRIQNYRAWPNPDVYREKVSYAVFV
ncbi:conserved hypothetical protein [Capnocytophaga canimorsus]|uniref:Uncharacterized protein n=1 Tax=Capnocytophaga canimorsus TaxID=28188 RepID=A0A0B7HQ34_9FLAO|nr:BACON domain-containing carbohydrate-binding protein [Capnocytophaga canimorsus]CEN40017.1 conserved hypothetical protein [Capnocytophaga canimorsus]